MTVWRFILLTCVVVPAISASVPHNPVPIRIETPRQPGGASGALVRLAENSGGKTPVVKAFDVDWVRALAERGEPTVHTRANSANFEYLGMPVGGIGAGQVYLGGDGKLWWWDIFNTFSADSRTGEKSYANPIGRSATGIFNRLRQGFAVQTTVDGKTTTMILDRDGPRDISFRGEYPIGRVSYRDPDLPVRVDLEAYSPFVPLDLGDSAYPAVVLEFTVMNPLGVDVDVALAGWLENAACLDSRNFVPGTLDNRIFHDPGMTVLSLAARPEATPSRRRTRSDRADILFDDFERDGHGRWQATGEAFGQGPEDLHARDRFGGERSRVASSRLVGTTGDSNLATGKLVSPSFRIEREQIVFGVGGPASGDTHVDLVVDGEVVRSTRGMFGKFFLSHPRRLTPARFDVRDLQGREAHLEIVDGPAGDRAGHIIVDDIVFTDDAGEARPVAGKLRDEGSLALAVLGEGNLTRASVPAGQLPAAVFTADERTGVGTGFAEGPLVGSVGWHFRLGRGQTRKVRFVLGWYFPNLRREEERLKTPVGRWYASRFASARDVVRHVGDRIEDLGAQTRLWRDTWYNSTLPYWFLDRTFLNTSILATSTSLLYGDGRFFGYEGYYQGPGTCTHVWGYVQAMGRLFPEIERGLRERVDYAPGIGFVPKTGEIHFRAEHNDRNAVDGQSGVILRTLLAHQMSPDKAFLSRNYAAMKQAMDFLVDTYDEDRDGVMTGPQHNTLDGTWYGRVTWLSLHYTAALRAAAVMADEMNDTGYAAEMRTLAERGRRYIEQRLFNGEYFFHEGDPEHPDSPGVYTGNEYSQLLGQSWAYQVGLGQIVDPAKVTTALNSLWKYNFTTDVGPFREEHPTGRWYAMPGEGGLIACTWPRGGSEVLLKGPARHAAYNNECQNGYEYAATSLMMWHGLVDKALAHTKVMHERYAADRRNPWNEIEWGMHYARSMASYGLFTAVSGFEYDGPAGYLAFSPRLTPEDFRGAFTGAEGWGSLAQQREAGRQHAQIEVKWGRLTLRRLGFDVPAGARIRAVRVRQGGCGVITDFEQQGQRVNLMLRETARLQAGDALTVTIETEEIPADSARLQAKVAAVLPELGHRNWIVVVDSAYPAQTSAGIETVVANAPMTDVVRQVIAAVDAAPHVRPTVYTDAELDYVAEADAPGITDYRRELRAILGDREVQRLPHEEIISRLDAAGKTFKILLVKTPLTLPYTSVFLQLECGYWTPEAERRLRDAMKSNP